MASPQRQMLFTARLLWATVISGQLVLVGVAALFRGHHTLEFLGSRAGTTIFILAAVGWALCAGLGYHLRNQTYKRHWEGKAITPAGYFAGNLYLFLLCGLDSCLGLASVAAGYSWWLGILPTALMMVVLAINYPNGKAMEAAEVELGRA